MLHLLRCNAPESYLRWILYYLIETVHQRTAGIFECSGHDSPEERRGWDVGICKFPRDTFSGRDNASRVGEQRTSKTYSLFFYIWFLTRALLVDSLSLSTLRVA